MRRVKRRYWASFGIGLIVSVRLLAGGLGTAAAQGSKPTFDYTGHEVKDEKEMVIAVNTIYHDPDHPSRVVLPIIPRR